MVGISGLSPYSGVSANPFLVPQVPWQTPSQAIGALNPYTAQPVQQAQQVLQSVLQQVQQLLQLEYLKQHQLHQLQQVLLAVPTQLAQLQQHPQFGQQSQQQPFVPGGIPMSPLWSASQTAFQPSYVM
jgi:hypothetical protein